MKALKSLAGRLHRWHEKATGYVLLATAADVTRGSGCTARYGLRLRASMRGHITLGDNVTFNRWVDLICREGTIEIGDECYFGKSCVIVARDSITIGPGCQIAEHVTIRDQDHRIEPGVPIAKSGFDTAPVVIGAHVWIGAGAVITRGVTIGDGAVIGAGAVVTRDIPAGARAVGVPARVLD